MDMSMKKRRTVARQAAARGPLTQLILLLPSRTAIFPENPCCAGVQGQFRFQLKLRRTGRRERDVLAAGLGNGKINPVLTSARSCDETRPKID